MCTLMWASGPWSPLPETERAIGWFGLIGWITVPWAALADRHYALKHLTTALRRIRPGATG